MKLGRSACFCLSYAQAHTTDTLIQSHLALAFQHTISGHKDAVAKLTRSLSDFHAPPCCRAPNQNLRISSCSRLLAILASLGLGYTKWASVFRRSLLFAFLLYTCLFFLLFYWCFLGRWEGVTKREFETVGKKEKGTGMHIDTSPASLPPFPVGFILFSPLLFASTCYFPTNPPDLSFLLIPFHYGLYTYFRGFDERDGGTERKCLWASWLWAGTRRESES